MGRSKSYSDAKAYIDGTCTFAIMLIVGYALIPSFPKKERAKFKKSLDKMAKML